MTRPAAPSGVLPASVPGAVVAAGSSIGRYFNLTSLVPAVLLVLWCYGLLGLRAFDQEPSWTVLAQVLVPDTRAIVPMVLAALMIAFFLHPLQFGMIRLVEGYWGSSRLALLVASHRINVYRRFARELKQLSVDYSWSMEDKARRQYDPDPDYPDDKFSVDEQYGDSDGDMLMFDYLGWQEANRRRQHYPAKEERILPTRFGNALRRYEDLAGDAYGLPWLIVGPHLLLHGDQEQARYVQGQGEGMDAAIRFCLTSAVATVLTIVAFANDGIWWLLVLVPYGLTYVAYRGAVTAARNYGVAFSAFLDLNRFALYEAFGLRRPTTLHGERRQNAALMKVLGGDDGAGLRYRPDEG